MGRRLFVGNLSYQTDENELTELFSQFGAVENAQIMRDMATGRARGFAFVEMATDDEAAAAATGLNNTQFGGRTIAVNEARPREQRSGGPGGGGAAAAAGPSAAEVVAAAVANLGGERFTGSQVHGFTGSEPVNPRTCEPEPVNREPVNL